MRVDNMPTCRKIGYESRADAARDARKASNRLRAYKCKECGLWHLTSQHNVSSKHRRAGEIEKRRQWLIANER